MGDVISRDIVAAARTRLTAHTTTGLLSACRCGQRAYEWPTKGQGVFSYYLCEGLDGEAWENGQIEFHRLAGYVGKQVRRWTAATPGLACGQEVWFEQYGGPEPIILAGGPASAESRQGQAV